MATEREPDYLAIIQQHNADLVRMCDERHCYMRPYKRECAECPRNWMVDLPPSAAIGEKMG